MKSKRKIIGFFDCQGIYIYQAFDKEIAAEAVQRGNFGKNFQLNRFSWIKPSWGWMLYRSNYANSPGQTHILKIKISHKGFLEILNNAIPTIQDSNIFVSGKEWRQKLQRAEVRYQWDPDRDSELKKLSRGAIQLGLAGKILENYAKKWILAVEDVTSLARKTELQPDNLELWPNEKEYCIDKEIAKKLGM